MVAKLSLLFNVQSDMMNLILERDGLLDECELLEKKKIELLTEQEELHLEKEKLKNEHERLRKQNEELQQKLIRLKDMKKKK